MNRDTLRRWIFVGALLALHLGNNALFLARVQQASVGITLFLLAGMVAMSQSVLLAAWAAFGRRHVVIRFSQSLCILALLSLVPSCAASNGNPPEAWRIVLIQGVLFTGSFAVFELVRRRTGWRMLRLHALLSSESRHARAKLTIRQLFELTALAAVVFAIARLSTDSQRSLPNLSQVVVALTIYGVASCVIALLFSPLVRLILGQGDRRRWAIRSVLSVGTAVCLFLGLQVWASALHPAELWMIAMFVTSIGGSLLMLRAAGYRLVDACAIGAIALAAAGGTTLA